MHERDITVSVVSHGQNALVNQLLDDVQRICADRVVLVATENIPDTIAISTSLPIERIANERIKGFGANHNAAFERCRSPYFCVLNPDIRLHADPFEPLLHELSDERVAVAGPLVRNPEGGIEDSARRFPTPVSLLRKVFVDRRQPDYPTDRGPQEVDWVAGMFMLFRAEAYRATRGFDEAYFLYYEDVDLCRRLRKAGKSVRYVPAAEVVHDARRSSRRSLQHAWWHLGSVARFLRR